MIENSIIVHWKESDTDLKFKNVYVMLWGVKEKEEK